MQKQHKQRYFVKIIVETHQFQPKCPPTMWRTKLCESQKFRILTLRWVPKLGVRLTHMIANQCQGWVAGILQGILDSRAYHQRKKKKHSLWGMLFECHYP
jgi:hypothetical protein